MDEPDLSVLDILGPTVTIDPATVTLAGLTTVGPAWFAWRPDRMNPYLDIRNGLWWLGDGSRVVSLATGADLHMGPTVDWETYVFLPTDIDIDICCHPSFELAQYCALTFFISGHWCERTWYPSEADLIVEDEPE